tara:strand:+ start:2481 stop:2669 length:189 start_codon:yes stop_codon:yes gene_type:complete
MTTKIRIGLPNQGDNNIAFDVIKEWEIEPVKTIGDTMFCKHDGTNFSILVEDYNKIIDNGRG